MAARLQLLGVMIDRSGIAKLETDRRPVSDIEIAAIAKVLEVDILSLFEERNSLLEQLNRGNELEHGTANRSAEKPNKSRDSSDR